MKGFYVTMRDSGRVAWLLGPFADHWLAIAAVPATRREATKIDAWCDFYAFGTSSVDAATLPAGKLNDLFRAMQ